MKFLKNLAKTGAAGLVLAGGLSLALIDRADAAGLTFKPTGLSVDGDSSKDIVTSVGSTIDFDLFFNTDGIADDDVVKELLYSFEWDVKELKIDSFNPLSQMGFLAGTSGVTGVYNVAQTLDPVLSPSPTSVKVATVAFKVLSGLNNDGKADFTLFSLGAFDEDGKSFTNLFNVGTQTVEVQPVPTPALIPGIAAMGMGLLRKRNKKAQAVAA